jgi:hypothetical protein
MWARAQWAAVVGAAIMAIPAPGEGQSASELMQKQRELHRLRDEEERQLLRLVSKTGAVKERRIVVYTLSGPGGLHMILLRFLAPRVVEITALLTWEAKDGDDDQWLYLPSTRKPKRVAASGKKNRFMGTDFAYEDLRPENPPANRYTLAGTEALEGAECLVVESVPATDRHAADTGYSKRKQWIRKDNLVTVKREYYDKQGKLEKVESRRKLVNVTGDVWRASEVEMQDVQNGTKTVLLIESRRFNVGLADAFFTEAELTR